MPRAGGSCSISLSERGFADFVALATARGLSRAELVEQMLGVDRPMVPRRPVRHHAKADVRLTAIDKMVLRVLTSWTTVGLLCEWLKRSGSDVAVSCEKLAATGALERHGDRLVMYRRARRPRRDALVVLRAAGLLPDEGVT